MTTVTRQGLLIEPDALSALLDDPTLVLVDVDDAARYQQQHVPGARQLDYPLLVRQQPPAMGLLPDDGQLRDIVTHLGIDHASQVVAYDSSGGGKASRLIWTLACLGLTNTRLLNGGLQGWVADGRAVAQGIDVQTPPGADDAVATPCVLTPAATSSACVDRDGVLARLGAPDVTVLDARSPAEYAGIDQRAARPGHIPGAINLDWTEVRDPARAGRLLPDMQLRTLLASRGVDPDARDRELIVYCQTHHRSALLWVMLKHLGFERVRGYVGSWSEWGNDPHVPIEP